MNGLIPYPRVSVGFAGHGSVERECSARRKRNRREQWSRWFSAWCTLVAVQGVQGVVECVDFSTG